MGFREIGPPDEFSCFFQSVIQFLFFFFIFLSYTYSHMLFISPPGSRFSPVFALGFCHVVCLASVETPGLRGPGAVIGAELKVFTPHPPTLPTLKKRDSNTVCL